MSIDAVLTRLFDAQLHARFHASRREPTDSPDAAAAAAAAAAANDADNDAAEFVFVKDKKAASSHAEVAAAAADAAAGDAEWRQLFVDFFLVESSLHDDLLFFVTTHNDLKVKRKTTAGAMPTVEVDEDEQINWMETFFLNLIVQTHCVLTVSVCKRDASHSKRYSTPPERVLGKPLVPPGSPDAESARNSPVSSASQQSKSKMVALRRISKKVYAAPYKSRMDVKDAFMNECAYPLVYYTVNDYESSDLHLHIQEREYLCVELSVLVPENMGDTLEASMNSANSTFPLPPSVAADPTPFPVPEGFKKVVLFQGAVPYTALLDIFMQKGGASSAYQKKTSREWGSLSTKNLKTERTEYIMMRGPRGKGVCQVAICENVLTDPDVSVSKSQPESPVGSFPSTSSLLNMLGGTVKTGLNILRNGISGDTFFVGSPPSGSLSGTTSTSPPRKPDALKCSMTYVNVPWHSIIR
ncbi:hypothetical protein HDU82_003705 [Entophlyctis luteolus]|nr:hypothetical protein HDU82_003705 [Entophlyctis luteolus]